MSEVTDLENSVKEKNPIRQIPQKQRALKDWKNKTNKKPPAKNESNGGKYIFVYYLMFKILFIVGK